MSIEDFMNMLAGALSGNAKEDAKNRARIQLCAKGKCGGYITQHNIRECIFDQNCPVLDALAIAEFGQKYPVGKKVAGIVAISGGCDWMPPYYAAPVDMGGDLIPTDNGKIVAEQVITNLSNKGPYLEGYLRAYLYNYLPLTREDIDDDSGEDFGDEGEGDSVTDEEAWDFLYPRGRSFCNGWIWAVRNIVMELYKAGLLDLQRDK